MPRGIYRQIATYWGTGVIDGYGKRAFTAPTSIMVRWQDQNALKIQKNGEDIHCIAIVYVQDTLELGGYLILGDYTGNDPVITAVTDPTTIDANIIFDIDTCQSVTTTDLNRRVFLKPG